MIYETYEVHVFDICQKYPNLWISSTRQFETEKEAIQCADYYRSFINLPVQIFKVTREEIK